MNIHNLVNFQKQMSIIHLNTLNAKKKKKKLHKYFINIKYIKKILTCLGWTTTGHLSF